GLDARAMLQPSTVSVQPGSRAVVQMPAPGSTRIAVRILQAPEARRRQVEEILKRTIQNVDIVGANHPARFLIDAASAALHLLTPDGRQVGTFDGRTDQWGQEVARVISRSVGASELLSLDNPTSQVRLQAQVVGDSQGGTRDIVLVADTKPAQLHIRRANEPRATQNSLQISVSVNMDAYITIVDIDSEGHANLLFPNTYQRSDFWPDGRVPGGRPLLIPDSLAEGGRAGFFWDYGPPAGIDTVRIFATTDSSTARLIRDRIRGLQAGPAGTRGISGADTTVVSEGLRGLRNDLTGLATRGIVVTQDSAAAGGQQLTQGPSDWAATSLTVAIAQ